MHTPLERSGASEPSVGSGETGLPEVHTLERAEERLVPHVEQVPAGRVVVAKRVVSEPETITVALRHDELDVERVAVNRPLERGEQPVTERGDETVVLVIEERLEPRLVPYVVEEVHLRRRLVTEEREITDTVRKERLDVRVEGEVQLNQRDA